MKVSELKRKARANEGMTVEEIKAYEKLVKPKVQVYGKYGTLAKQYLQEHNIGKYMALAGDLPEYLHICLFTIQTQKIVNIQHL